MQTLETPRTRLRRFCSDDFENMRLLESDPDVVKWTPMRTPRSPEQTREKLQALLGRPVGPAPFGIWAVERKSDLAFVGWFMLIQAPDQNYELGFMLVQNFWGQGLATEVSNELLQNAFRIPHLEFVFAKTDPANDPSIGVLMKLGFENVETTKDSKIFRISKNKFQERQGP